jgi:pimeloyl-ACP methyl ester carboxylesterase
MAAVFGSSFVYWSAVKLLGGSMLAMFVPRSIRRQMSPADLAEIKRGILLSGLPVSRRTRGVLFDMYVSNPSIEGPIPFESIESPAILLHAEDDPSCLVAGARVLAERIPKSQLHTFASGGHLLLGHEEEIRALVRGFAGLQ